MATPNIVPRADSEGGLGTASKYWAAAYIDLIDAGNINCSTSSTFVIQHTTANQDIRFKGIDGSSSITALLLDMSAAGAATFSGNLTLTTGDFFLASGAVINFDNSDVTLTHSSNTLVLDGGDFKFRTSKKAVFGDAGSIEIYSDNTHGYIKNTTTDGDLVLMSDDGSSGETAYLTLDGSAEKIVVSKPLNLLDSTGLKLGTGGNDFSVYHNGTDTYLDNNTGNLNIRNTTVDKDIIFSGDDGSGGVTAYITLDGGDTNIKISKPMQFANSVRAYFGSSNSSEIMHNGTDMSVSNYAGDIKFINYADDKDIIFQSDNGAGGTATYFYLDGSSAAHNGSATTALYTNWPDNSRISLGTSHDLMMYHNGSHSWIWNDVGDLYINNAQNDGDIIFRSDDGSGGITEYFRLDGSDVKIISSQAFHLLDNKSLIAGTGSDFTINHDGTNSYLSNNTGDLYIRNLADDKDIIFQSDDGSGGVETYFFLDGSASSGNPFTVFPDLSELAFGTSRDLRIKHDGTDSKITNSTGDLYIINNADDKDIIFQSDDGSGGVTEYFRLDGGIKRTIFTENIGLEDNTQILIGSGNDLQMYHDGSHSFISDTGTGNLYINGSTVYLRANENENAVVCNANGSVDLYHDGSASPKLSTTSTGVAVTGSLTPSLGVTKPIASAAANVAAAVAGSIYTFSDADGAIVTLPDSGGGGLVGQTFEFVCTATATSNSHKVIFSDTTNEKFIGRLTAIDTDTDNTQLVYVPATANKAIVMNGTTTGITGSRFTITNVAADIWMIEGYVHHTGNTANPFANS